MAIPESRWVRPSPTEVGGPRTPARRRQRDPGSEGYARTSDIDGNDPGRLVDVESYEGPDFIGLSNNGLDILYEAAAKYHVGDRNQRRNFVDRVDHGLGRHGKSVRRRNEGDPRTAALLSSIQLHDGREIQLGADHPVARSREVETRGDDSRCQRDRKSVV